MTATTGLVVRDLTVDYGGLRALNVLSLDAPPGLITGLIGPNGAGKTTAFNVLSGFVAPSKGSVQLADEDLLRLSPAARAQRGLGRTFQRFELCESMSVADNIRLGKEARLVGANPTRHVRARRGDQTEIDRAVKEALELCGLVGLATSPVSSLSTGQRRLVELARVVAASFTMLLLDEPSSGLDAAETLQLSAVLTQLASNGVGMVLVEHDMALVMDICSYIYVVEFGMPLYDGTPSEVMKSDEVRRAYLGTEPTTAAEDG